MSTDRDPEDGAPVPDLHKLVQIWTTPRQSEVAALAVDREAQQTWPAMPALWAGAASAMLQALAHEHPERGAGTTAASATETAAAAPDARDVAIERLTRRIAELEGRLADVEHGHPRNTTGCAGAPGRRGVARPHLRRDHAATGGSD